MLKLAKFIFILVTLILVLQLASTEISIPKQVLLILAFQINDDNDDDVTNLDM